MKLIEPLEHRIAPASASITYTDIDGDLVKITVTAPGSTALRLTVANLAFTDGDPDGQLSLLSLSDPLFNNASITFSVTKKPGGDGLAAVGRINAGSNDLGAVVVKGDLGVIDAGSGNDTVPAIKSLTVQSMGLYGTDAGAPADLRSDITGALGTLTVATDVKDVYIFVGDSFSAAAKIGTVKIGGSLFGGLATNSGRIFSYGGIGSVTIGGNVIGGAGNSSGMVAVFGGEIGGLTITGSLVGGSGTASGQIFNAFGGIGAVKIGGNLRGDLGAESGKIDVQGNLVSLTIGGSVIGGAGAANTYTDTDSVIHRGQVFAGGNIGPVKVAHDVRGGVGIDTGRIQAGGSMGAVAVGGSVVGVGVYSGVISANTGMGAVSIGHDVIGGATGSGTIFSSTTMGAVTVGGSLIGGTGNESGWIRSHSVMGAVKIGHDIVGGTGEQTGQIRMNLAGDSKLAGVTIGGSIIGGTDRGAGGIFAAGDLGPVKIGLDLLGGNLVSGESTLINSGFIYSGGTITSVTVGGSIIAGIDNSTSGDLENNASIRAVGRLGSLTVKGDIAGNFLGEDPSRVYIAARGVSVAGAADDLAIGKIVVGRRVEEASFLAGYDTALAPKNADAKIGSVTVGGDWIASNLVAGTMNLGGGTGNFGNNSDVVISGAGTVDEAADRSTIKSVTITGRALGSPSTNRFFGISTQDLGTIKILGRTVAHSGDGIVLGGLTNFNAIAVGNPTAYFPEAGLAELASASSVTYTDIDGDRVTVKLSKPLLTAANVNSVFKFNVGTVGDGADQLRQLQLIDLTPLATHMIGITMTVQRQAYGDGLADVGAIRATNLDVGAVSVPGDLGQIDAGLTNPLGSSGPGIGLDSLKVRSMGRLGIQTQAVGGSLVSEIDGSIGTLTVTGDLKDVTISPGFTIGLFGTVANLTVGGSLIEATIGANTPMNSAKIGGGIYAGALEGGAKSITIGGSVIGGITTLSGSIITGLPNSSMGTLKIAGNLVGGLVQETGRIFSSGTLGAVTLGGSVIGGVGEISGVIEATTHAGAMKIGHNMIGKGDTSAVLSAIKIGGVSIGGSLLGGAGPNSGKIMAFGAAEAATGAVTIGHNLLGGSGLESGRVTTSGLPSLTIGGSLIGGSNELAGSVNANQAGALKIAHDFAGGIGEQSGDISATFFTGITIGGSMVGGTAENAGSIFVISDTGALKIGRDLLGGSISGATPLLHGSGKILSTVQIKSVTIGGSIITGVDNSTAGALSSNATIRAVADIGSVTIAGSVVGRATANGSTPAVISAGHDLDATATKDLVIGKVSIGGSASLTNILAGYSTSLAANNSNAQMGAVSVGGNWLLGNIVAGAENEAGTSTTTDDNINYGDTHDRIINNDPNSIAKIASIAVKGVVAGSAANGDHFGFVARVIGSVKTAGYTAPLRLDYTGEEAPLSLITGDFRVKEI